MPQMNLQKTIGVRGVLETMVVALDLNLKEMFVEDHKEEDGEDPIEDRLYICFNTFTLLFPFLYPFVSWSRKFITDLF